ncbi:enoyl-CoA hydratase-related protein [uncultured Marivita sp.]|uniref:enoyl-CoA hydratase-related protein n=1 Tax=uncultured Marivita sp. TaxID=888080 RepID=UPI002618001D|nr:enoyl-CoA hydratase-related protein [uncultured Marivita sp.]
MGAETDISVRNGVAHVVLDAGPSARLNHRVIAALDAALTQLAEDDTVEIIVIRGKGASFPSGITEPQGGGDDRGNHLSDLCQRLESSAKPVVAVLTGTVVGAGVEIALACHYRLAQAQTRIGFPHARLGLVPSAGATQRLPRLVGAEETLDLLLGGHLRPMTSGKLSALVDQVFDDTAEAAIERFISDLRSKGAKPRPTADRRVGFADAAAYHAAVKRARVQIDASPEVTPKHILSAVEAAMLLPIDAGLAFEQAAAEDCAATDQSAALAHLFHAEQAVSAQTRRADLPDMSTIAVLGGSPIAVQIVLAALESGVAVNWLIKDPQQQRDSVGHVRSVLKDAVTSGQMDEARLTRSLDLMRYGDTDAVIADADIVLRATRGQRGVSVPPGIPLAHCLPGTDPRLALHFAPPASTSRLVEVILGPQSTDTDRLAALALARRLNKLPVVETTSGAGIYDRLRQTLWRAADSLVDLGQSPFSIDAALRHWGMPHPPYEMADLLGFDTVARQDRPEGSRNWTALLARSDRQGRGSGRGYYTHMPSEPPQPDPGALALIESQRAPQPEMPAEKIVRLTLGAMANEGAKALREGVVPRSGDIDVISVFTHLAPTWHGGIMHAAGEAGLLQITRAMESVDHPDRALWTPDPVFAELIKYGRRFDDL